jgi:hypothetical protein
VEHELERFQRLFANEADLRNALAMLLRAMPEIEGVQITHGTQEIGKDIIFYSVGALKERRLNACVVKNSKITGSVDSSSGAMVVLHQVIQALDNAYVNSNGEPERVSVVYVITPFDVSQTAIRSVQGSLEKRSGQVTFLSGGQLLERFKDYMPEFLVFESGALGSYIAAVQKQIEKDDVLSSLAEQYALIARAGASFRENYVRQGFFQDFKGFKLVYAVPKIERLANLLTSDDVVEIGESARSLVRLLSLPYFTWPQEKTHDVSLMKTQLGVEFPKYLREAWNKAKSDIRDSNKGTGKKSFEDKTAISLRPTAISHINEVFRPHIQLMSSKVGEVKSLADDANNFAANKENWEDLSGLRNPQYLTYCSVAQISKEVPHVLKQVSEFGIASYPEDILSIHSGHLMIVGAAGYGKTSFCKWSVMRDVENLVERSSSVLPVYVRLYQLATRRLGTYQEEFFENRDLHHLLAPHPQQTVATIRIYLDGLDEVSSIDRQRELVGLAKTAAESDPRIQIVLTAREYVMGPWLSWIPQVRIAKFDEAQTRMLVENLLQHDAELIQSFFAALAKDSALQPLMSVPLLATLTVAVFKKTKALPPTRVRLYEIFTDLLLGGWDLIKNVRRKTQFGSAPKLMFLSHVAGKMHLYGQREVGYKELLSVAKNLGSMYERDCNRLVSEIVEDGLLTLGGGSYMFAHLSFQEYLAAKDLNDPTGKRQGTVLREFLKGSDWWREVLLFYMGIAARPAELHQWINLAFSEVSAKQPSAPDCVVRYQFLMKSITHMFPGWTAGG